MLLLSSLTRHHRFSLKQILRGLVSESHWVCFSALGRRSLRINWMSPPPEDKNASRKVSLISCTFCNTTSALANNCVHFGGSFLFKVNLKMETFQQKSNSVSNKSSGRRTLLTLLPQLWRLTYCQRALRGEEVFLGTQTVSADWKLALYHGYPKEMTHLRSLCSRYVSAIT